MSVIDDVWRRGQCPPLAGLFFADDSAVVLPIAAGAGPPERVDVSSLWDLADPDACDGITGLCSARSDAQLARAGECSFEGDGWIALFERASGLLRWILVLSQSEAFHHVEFADGLLRAEAIYYPHRNTLEIPLENPCAFTLVKRNEY